MNRVVALLTPFFTAGAAVASRLLLTTIGVHVSPAEIVGVESLAAVSVLSIALKWLHGWQAFEKFQHDKIILELEHDFALSLTSTDPTTVGQSVADVEKAAEEALTRALPTIAPQIAGEAAKLIGISLSRAPVPVPTTTGGTVPATTAAKPV